jgi:hypothetical protein
MAADYTGAWKLLYDWQTLATGLLALLAASIAAWPVWRQIRNQQLQSAVMAREVLLMRIAAIEARRDTTRKKLDGVTSDFMRRIYPHEWVAEPDISPEWASEAEQIVNEVLAALTANQETSFDGELIDTKRRVVIGQAKELSACLSEIHAPHSHDLDDPELNLSTEQIAAVQAAATGAEGNLEQRISAVGKSSRELDAAFEVSLERIRARIRQIDVLVHDRSPGQR